MRRFMLIALIASPILLSACQPDYSDDIDELRAEAMQQQAEIERLSTLVDAQANVIRTCQETVAELIDFLVNKGTIGKLGSAKKQWEHLGACKTAMSDYSQTVSKNEIQSPEQPSVTIPGDE